MKTAIFIRTFKDDLPWLSYCLRSIAKFCTGFSEVVVAIPEGQQHLLSHLTRERVVVVNDAPCGYLHQQVTKLSADLHTTSDLVLHVDSDCTFVKPVTPETFMRGSRPVWLMTPWEQCPDAKKAWFHVLAKLFLSVPEHDFMRRCTIMVPRWAYAGFRKFIRDQSGYEYDSYIMNQPNREFTEYSTLGYWLWKFHRDKIAWHDTSIDGVPEPVINQEWSHGGLTPEIKQKLELITA